MKAKTGFYIIVTSIILTIIMFELFFNNKKSSHEDFYKQLAKNEFLDTIYIDFVEYSFKKAQKYLDLDLDLNINSEYDSSKLNIYIIDYFKVKKTPKTKRKLSGKINKLLSSCENNILAIPKNLLIIDSEFLGLSMKHANDCFTANANIGATYGEYYSEEIAERIRFSDLNAKRYMGVAGLSLLKRGNYVENEFKSDLYRLMPRTFFSYIFPLIAHELAHIKYHQENLNYGFIDGNLILDNFEKLYEMETEADSISSVAVNLYIKALLNGEVEDDSPMGFNDVTHDISFVKEFIMLLSNFVLNDIFYELREISPEDILLNIEQKSNIEQMMGNLDYSIISPDRVERITFTYPLLTKKEVDIIKNKFSENAIKTHKHMYDRSLDFTENIIGLKESKSSIYGSTVDFISLIHGDSNKLNQYYSDLIKGHSMQYKTKAFKNQFKDNFNFVEASKLQIEKGWIGFLNNDCGGYVELIESDNGSIFSIKLILPIIWNNCQKDNLNLFDKITSFFIPSHEFEKYEKELEDKFDIFSNSKNMDFITVVMEEENLKLRVQRLNDSKYFIIDVFPSTFNYDNLDVNNYFTKN